MPKLRTRKGLQDRIRITRTGKLIRRHAWKSHMLEHKSARRKRAYRSADLVASADRKEVRRMLGA